MDYMTKMKMLFSAGALTATLSAAGCVYHGMQRPSIEDDQRALISATSEAELPSAKARDAQLQLGLVGLLGLTCMGAAGLSIMEENERRDRSRGEYSTLAQRFHR